MTEGPVSPAPIGGWRTAIVREVTHPTARDVRLRLEIPDRVEHLPGQHYVVRLTAPDGYVAQRSYSIGSAPADPLLELFIERLPDGEVSGYLADVVERGDELQVRGPIGGWFVWRGDAPAVGIGGGSGVVPLVAMARHARDIGQPGLFRAVCAARTLDDLPYAAELASFGAVVGLSREAAPNGRPAGRLAASDMVSFLDGTTTFFVCGSAGFAESVTDLLVAAGIDESRVRVVRFGPSG